MWHYVAMLSRLPFTTNLQIMNELSLAYRSRQVDPSAEFAEFLVIGDTQAAVCLQITMYMQGRCDSQLSYLVIDEPTVALKRPLT
jgi:hypothetical protein